MFRLEFDRDVAGPLCLGHASHFGLGLFLPGRMIAIGPAVLLEPRMRTPRCCNRVRPVSVALLFDN